MESLLFLVHRLPYPPNKGDKVRSYHLLRYLSARYRVFLGTFVDDPRDDAYVEKVTQWCSELHVERLNPALAKLRSLTGLLMGEALTLPYYRNAGMARWVERTVKEQDIRTVVVYSSAMAQYVPDDPALNVLVDFVDVDSAKWTQYAQRKSGPMSWVYRREGQRLLAFERRMAERAAASFFTTDAEVALFRRLTPGCHAVVEAVSNGVDAVFFSPEHDLPSPFGPDETPVVFTGAMDYWPNVDAVCWFVSDILPALRQRCPGVRLYVVGMKPAPAVVALASEQVVVTGTVPDVRPYIKGAAVVVAPLRIARGVQNKVLEAMAMARPVVLSRACAGGVEARDGEDFLVADDEADFVDRIAALLASPDRGLAMGRAARERILAAYSWEAHLQRWDRHLAASGSDTPETDATMAGFE